VLQVVSTAERRGAEVFAVDLEPCLRQRGWDVRTVALSAGSTPDLDVPRLGRTPFGVPTLSALRSAARAADVVVAHGSSTLPACAIATLGLRVPTIYRNIGDPTQWSASPLRRARVAAALRRMSQVVALTDAAAATISSRYHVQASKLTVIPTGVSSTRFELKTPDQRKAARAELGLPGDAFVALCVAALSEEKRVDLVIDAIARTSAVDTLLVAGDGRLRTSLENQAQMQIPGRVRFLGAVSNIVPVLTAADVVVLASRTEGLPGALIEAGLTGIPTVASRVGYVEEIVSDGETGILYPSGDVVALVAALERTRRNVRTLGANARRHCLAHFDLEHVADRWNGAIARLMPA
jgi:glycosyltransferase involved in cell wall biosynthesis